MAAVRKGSKSDKFKKMKILSRNEFIKRHLPQTRVFNRDALRSMLTRYGSVYVKPRRGSFGKGVLKVYSSGRGYVVHSGKQLSRYSSFDSLYATLSRNLAGASYVVQRTIHAIKYNGRIVDFRVVVQLNPRGNAEVTGIAGRISQGGRVVSNGGGGGSLGDLATFFNGRQYYIVRNKLEVLALSIMRQVRHAYPRQTELGIDIAVDNQLNVWVIEHNYTPDHRMFLGFGRGVIGKIVRYGAVYGKRYRLI